MQRKSSTNSDHSLSSPGAAPAHSRFRLAATISMAMMSKKKQQQQQQPEKDHLYVGISVSDFPIPSFLSPTGASLPQLVSPTGASAPGSINLTRQRSTSSAQSHGIHPHPPNSSNSNGTQWLHSPHSSTKPSKMNLTVKVGSEKDAVPVSRKVSFFSSTVELQTPSARKMSPGLQQRHLKVKSARSKYHDLQAITKEQLEEETSQMFRDMADVREAKRAEIENQRHTEIFNKVWGELEVRFLQKKIEQKQQQAKKEKMDKMKKFQRKLYKELRHRDGSLDDDNMGLKADMEFLEQEMVSLVFGKAKDESAKVASVVSLDTKKEERGEKEEEEDRDIRKEQQEVSNGDLTEMIKTALKLSPGERNFFQYCNVLKYIESLDNCRPLRCFDLIQSMALVTHLRLQDNVPAATPLLDHENVWRIVISGQCQITEKKKAFTPRIITKVSAGQSFFSDILVPGLDDGVEGTEEVAEEVVVDNNNNNNNDNSGNGDKKNENVVVVGTEQDDNDEEDEFDELSSVTRESKKDLEDVNDDDDNEKDKEEKNADDDEDDEDDEEEDDYNSTSNYKDDASVANSKKGTNLNSVAATTTTNVNTTTTNTNLNSNTEGTRRVVTLTPCCFATLERQSYFTVQSVNTRMIQNRLKFFQCVPQLVGLDPRALIHFALMCKKIHWRPHQTIISQDADCDSIYLIAKGHVRIVRSIPLSIVGDATPRRPKSAGESTTTSNNDSVMTHFDVGMLGLGQCVGEATLFPDPTTNEIYNHPFSVVTSTLVTTYSVNRMEMMTKVSRDLRDQFKSLKHSFLLPSDDQIINEIRVTAMWENYKTSALGAVLTEKFMQSGRVGREMPPEPIPDSVAPGVSRYGGLYSNCLGTLGTVVRC